MTSLFVQKTKNLAYLHIWGNLKGPSCIQRRDPNCAVPVVTLEHEARFSDKLGTIPGCHKMVPKRKRKFDYLLHEEFIDVAV